MLTDAEQATVREVRGRVEAAEREVDALSRGDHDWRMSVPVQARDSDVVIQDALSDIYALLRIIERLAAENEALRSGREQPY